MPHNKQMENKQKTIIEWAIKGNWDWIRCYGYPPNSTFGELEMENIMSNRERFACDPKLFQAIGRAVGWDKMPWNKNKYGKSADIFVALNFHEINFNQNMDSAIDYLYGLLPVKE
jgi:hypothetical protein